MAKLIRHNGTEVDYSIATICLDSEQGKGINLGEELLINDTTYEVVSLGYDLIDPTKINLDIVEKEPPTKQQIMMPPPIMLYKSVPC